MSNFSVLFLLIFYKTRHARMCLLYWLVACCMSGSGGCSGVATLVIIQKFQISSGIEKHMVHLIIGDYRSHRDAYNNNIAYS